MSPFKNLSIRGKFSLIVLLFFVLEAAIALVGITFLRAMNQSLVGIADVELRRVELTANMQRNLLGIQSLKRGMVIADTKDVVNQYSADIARLDAETREMATEMEEKSGEVGTSLTRKFMSDYQNFVEVANELKFLLLKALEQSTSATDKSSIGTPMSLNREAIRLLHEKGNEAYEQAAASLKAVSDRNRERLALAKASANDDISKAITIMGALSFIGVALGLSVGLIASRSISIGLNQIMTVADDISAGNLETPVKIERSDEVGRLATAITRMQTSLRGANDEVAGRDWLKTGIVRLNEAMHGELDVDGLSAKIIDEVATYLDVPIGALYLSDNTRNGSVLTLSGGYAYTKREKPSGQFKLGEGLVGQAAMDKKQILVNDVPEDYIKVISGLGETSPRFILVTPFLFEDRVTGVIEIGSLNRFTDLQLEYMSRAVSAIAPNVEASQKREELKKALSESQSLATKLQVQQEELSVTNEELEEQTQLLKESEEKLKEQQEELRAVNEELEEKNDSLKLQTASIEEANRELEITRHEIEAKAEELATSSKYKSEFLANMSHELRTPLNSLLLLSKLLADNRDGNLTEEQVESAATIYSSGNDLLSLLNEILDLSKIEAGRMDIHVEGVQLRDIAESIRTSFQAIAHEKGLNLDVFVSGDAPVEISTDRKRVEQILKNLVSNAVKFTEEGGVAISFSRPANRVELSASGLNPDSVVAIAVKDTGIGIPADKQKVIFEAFQQAEGGTSRKFSGTGLGLSISTRLANLLGGEIQLRSEVGKGSTFTVYLPAELKVSASQVRAKLAEQQKTPLAQPRTSVAQHILDDRESIKEGEKVVLIIEDDPNFAKLLLRQCHEKGFKCLACPSGEEGLELAQKYLPIGIILDIRLPGIDGWVVLDTLKESPKTRHIPVHIMSVEEATIEAFRKGAIGYLTKPAAQKELEEAFRKLETMFSKRVKDLLVVEDDDVQRKSIIKLVGNNDVHAEEAMTGEETIRTLKNKKFDCMILDLGLPDMTGFELLKKLEAEENIVIPPIIVYTGKELTRAEETELHKYSESIIIKGVRSEERLLDEVSLFLHRVVDNLPERKRKIIANLHDKDAMFINKRILIVDDDMRNVFAIAKVMEQKGMTVLKAENGQKALQVLEEQPIVDLVLMDIMMPIMDGYETMKRIRELEKFQEMPIIALTAKAMKEDRSRSIAAGASDYLSKPVDLNRLFSMMRVWLYR